MPPSAAAGLAPDTASAPARRLVLLPREPHASHRPPGPEAEPRRYRLARLERTDAARAERFAHLKRQYD